MATRPNIEAIQMNNTFVDGRMVRLNDSQMRSMGSHADAEAYFKIISLILNNTYYDKLHVHVNLTMFIEL